MRTLTKKEKTRSRWCLRILAVFYVVLAVIHPSYAEISAESYCQVAVGIAQQQVNYLTGLVPLVEKYCEDPNFWPVYAAEPNSFLNEKAVPRKTLDDQRAALIGSHDTTVEELYIFEADNQDAIAQYLNNNPDTQQAINSLSAQIGALTNKIKVPYYCLAVVANTKLEIKNAAELIALAQQLSNDKDLFLEQEQAMRKKHNAAKEALRRLCSSPSTGQRTSI